MEMDKGCARYALRYWLTTWRRTIPRCGGTLACLYCAGARRHQAHRGRAKRHYIKESEKYEERLHQRELLRRIKTLRRVELFAQMTDDELRKLASVSVCAVCQGNVIAKQGTPRSTGCSSSSAASRGLSRGGEWEKRILNVLSNGAFFGEMSLMTGSPRVASVLPELMWNATPRQGSF